ncbi:MAG: His/Gly/Thr/Pro-type tRNA ligase C-terminal domain-containing protein [Mollicutes bacterium]|nr:MAG: His/Gly/Thr/Pro-type tRNA ligase C-terminal domain-containing protein [Mollicutes bacterium]
MQGIPLRLEIGEKEVTNQSITVVPRISLKKSLYTVQDFSEQVVDIFKNIETEM